MELQNKTWNKTMDLRHVRQPTYSYKRNGERGQEQAGFRFVLQQRSVCVETGEECWFDVPVVNERDVRKEWEPKKEEANATAGAVQQGQNA